MKPFPPAEPPTPPTRTKRSLAKLRALEIKALGCSPFADSVEKEGERLEKMSSSNWRKMAEDFVTGRRGGQGEVWRQDRAQEQQEDDGYDVPLVLLINPRRLPARILALPQRPPHLRRRLHYIMRHHHRLRRRLQRRGQGFSRPLKASTALVHHSVLPFRWRARHPQPSQIPHHGQR